MRTTTGEQQDVIRDLDAYKSKLREVKVLLIELEAMIASDALNRARIHD